MLHAPNRAITKRVEYLGRRVGVEGLSAHDGWHSWATRAAREKTDAFALQEAGGWNSLAIPRHYVESARITNEGVKLGEDEAAKAANYPVADYTLAEGMIDQNQLPVLLHKPPVLASQVRQLGRRWTVRGRTATRLLM
jgi:hypothetical protein